MLPRKTIAPKRQGNLAWLYPPQATRIDWDSIPDDEHKNIKLVVTDLGDEALLVLVEFPWLTISPAVRIAKRRLQRRGEE